MPYKVAIVDDHPRVCECLILLVSCLLGGAQIFTVGNTAQALAQAELHTLLDVVVLDCSLPDADGGSLIQALSYRSGNASVVVFSGIELDEAVARLMQLAATAFVPKSRDTREVNEKTQGDSSTACTGKLQSKQVKVHIVVELPAMYSIAYSI